MLQRSLRLCTLHSRNAKANDFYKIKGGIIDGKVVSAEEVIIEDTYKAHWSERPYMDSYPQLGKVHPSTGYIKVLVNGEEKVSKRIATDLEYIWDTYQQEGLPDCAKYAMEIAAYLCFINLHYCNYCNRLHC